MCHCYDPPEFSTTTTPRAVKPHRCDECYRTIEPGERYEKVVGKWDGDLYTFRTCPGCVLTRVFLLLATDCSCWVYGGLQEDLDEALQWWPLPMPEAA